MVLPGLHMHCVADMLISQDPAAINGYLVRWHFEHLQRLANTKEHVSSPQGYEDNLHKQAVLHKCLKNVGCVQVLKVLKEDNYFFYHKFLATVPGSRSQSMLPLTEISTKTVEKPFYTGRTGVRIEFSGLQNVPLPIAHILCNIPTSLLFGSENTCHPGGEISKGCTSPVTHHPAASSQGSKMG